MATFKRLSVLVFAALAWASAALPALAQLDDGTPPDYVAVKTYLDRDAYRPGESARLVVELKIDPRVHINTNKPTEDYQFPTSIEWTELAGLESSPVSWPKGAMKAFEFTEGKKIGVYEGTQRATLSLKVPADATPGARKLEGTLRAQGCTHTTCYAPQSDPFELLLRVVAAGEPTAAVNEDKFAALASSDSPAAPSGAADAEAGSDDTASILGTPAPAEAVEQAEGAAAAGLTESPAVAGLTAAEVEAESDPEAGSDDLGAATSSAAPRVAASVPHAEDPAPECPVEAQKSLGKDKSLALIFFLTFIGGIGLAFTPCVLPLVPITVGFFARQQEGGKRPVVPALMYVLGLALVYSALGTLAALSGGLFGSILQKPIVLVGVAALLFALALSMFGLWDLSLPSSISNRLGGGRAGNLGAMGMGGAMGLIAAPCVGPFVVSLLTYVAELGSRMPRPSAALLGGSLFMALSLGLGLPFFLVALGAGSLRPGEWMVSVKKVFGFVIFGVVLWFLRPLIGGPAFQWGLVALLLAAGIYFLLHSRAPQHGARARQAVAAVGVLALVGMVGWGAVVIDSMRARGGSVAGGFTEYDEDLLARAKADGRPVLIDFTADWCIACKELEHRTFPDERVQAKMKDFLVLRCDLTKQDEEAERIHKEWKIPGLPAIVFLDSSGEEIRPLRLEGFETADAFLQRMDCVSAVLVASR